MSLSTAMKSMQMVNINKKEKDLEERLGVIQEVHNELPQVMPLIGMYFITRIVVKGTEKVRKVVAGVIASTTGGKEGFYLLDMLIVAGDGEGDTHSVVTSIEELQRGYRLYDDRNAWVAEVQKAEALVSKKK